MLCLLSSFVVVLSLVSTACCDTVATADDLISLFKHATGNTLQTDIEVTADLDFSSSNLTLPLGAFSNGTCVAFSGVFQGNGHSIKGLKMDNTNNGGYKHAGLFCSLKDAIIENLVIDSSCSFNGWQAGALSASLNGSLTANNITNNAAVSGSYRIGGFIGEIKDLKQPSVILFDNCINNGTVTGICSGGLIGFISGNISMTMIVSHSINNKKVDGKNNKAGGFVGHVYKTSMTMTIVNSTNNGPITGFSLMGGFVGFFSSSTSATVAIFNCMNNGMATGGDNSQVGGFIGSTHRNKNTTTTITNSINNGNLTGGLYAGGFVGYIYSSQRDSEAFDIINSANKGSVSSKKDMACGFVCVDSEDNMNVRQP